VIGLEEKVLVSVCCTAYNHEKYIRSCLDGFVNQKTNFKYEVIVHDDASTDNTASIIQEYADKYPKIIKPILQKENQYSKDVLIYEDYLYPQCKGKYIAFCEGDDFWCDENKLQKQVDVLEDNLDYVACVHQTKTLDLKRKKESLFVKCDKDSILETEKFFSATIPYQTSSLMYRFELVNKRPSFCFVSKQVGDYPTAVFLTLTGPVYYLNQTMSVYRKFTEGSWSLRSITKPNIRNFKDMIEILTLADEYSNYRYHELIDKKIFGYEYRLWKHTVGFEVITNDRFKLLSVSKKLKMVFYILCRKLGVGIR